MPEIAPDTVSERLEADDDDLILVDIRHEEAFEEWHVPGSENVDVYDELNNDPESAADALASLPRDREIVTVCAVGKMSAAATELLEEMGYDAKTLVDGMRGWARVHRTGMVPTETARVVQVARPGTGCLSYVVVSDGEALVVDPSQYTEQYEALLEEHDATLAAVLETHAHADHVSGAGQLAAPHGVPHYLHPADQGDLTDTAVIEDEAELRVGSSSVEVIHTPGHTEGSVTLDLDGEALFTGDTLFLESVGRPDLEGGDEQAVAERAETLHGSVQTLLDRPDRAYVLPAHEPGSPTPPMTTTLGAVREDNELLGVAGDEFVVAITDDVPDAPPNHERIKRANVGREELTASEARQLELGPNKCAAE